MKFIEVFANLTHSVGAILGDELANRLWRASRAIVIAVTRFGDKGSIETRESELRQTRVPGPWKSRDVIERIPRSSDG